MIGQATVATQDQQVVAVGALLGAPPRRQFVGVCAVLAGEFHLVDMVQCERIYLGATGGDGRSDRQVGFGVVGPLDRGLDGLRRRGE